MLRYNNGFVGVMNGRDLDGYSDQQKNVICFSGLFVGSAQSRNRTAGKASICK